MNYKINVTDTANHDLIEIIYYFYDLNREFSEQLYKSIKEKIHSLESLPERGIVVPELENKGIRKFRQILSGNYRIIYSIDSDTIFINSIIDSRRNLEELLIEKLHNEIRRTTSSS
jgi:toxin ParE1/3/4